MLANKAFRAVPEHREFVKIYREFVVKIYVQVKGESDF